MHTSSLGCSLGVAELAPGIRGAAQAQGHTIAYVCDNMQLHSSTSYSR